MHPAIGYLRSTIRTDTWTTQLQTSDDPHPGHLSFEFAKNSNVCMCWSIERLGQGVLHVANAMAELDAAGVSLHSDQQAIDSTSPFGKAMIQMAFKAAPHGVLEHLVEGRAFVPTPGRH